MNLSGVVVTKATGIFQSDLIIRSALDEMLRELRTRPDLIDRCFAGLFADPLVGRTYGPGEVEGARRWFLSHRIPVVAAGRMSKPVFPCVTVGMASSRESRNTLADANYEVVEQVDELPRGPRPSPAPTAQWHDLTRPLAPDYDRMTGVVSVPSDQMDGLVVAPGQLLVLRDGTSVEILEDLGTVDGAEQFRVAAGVTREMNGAVVRGKPPARLVQLHSARFDEQYSIMCHAQNEPVHAIYLHALVLFQLLRRRQDLLEARGVDQTWVESAPPVRSTEEFFQGPAESLYSRAITLSAVVLQWWPGLEQPSVQDTRVASTPASVAEVADEDTEGFSLVLP